MPFRDKRFLEQMVTVVQPEGIVRVGEFKGNLESCLRRYSERFVNDASPVGLGYSLFRREDPSLLYVFNSHSLRNYAGITVVSYDLQKNDEILRAFTKKAGIKLMAGGDCPLAQLIDEGLLEVCKRIFSDLVLS